MSFYPAATQLLLPESHTQPVIAPRIAILHSAAGRGSLYRFFRDASSLESHFWVSETGIVEQYVDTNRRADANRNANGYAVSIETESSPSATERWTPAQAAAIVRLLDWLCTEHPNIKRRQCDTATGSGIGWHIQFGTPGPWTPVAKSCPGPARIVQARDEIIPAVIAAGNPTPTPKGWLMALTDDQQKDLYDKVCEIHAETAVSTAQNKAKGIKGSGRWLLAKIAKGEKVT